MKPLSNKRRKLAKKRFPKQPHTTRPITPQDIQDLPQAVTLDLATIEANVVARLHETHFELA